MEANARLTGITGLLLLVMLAAEGLTILSIHRLLSWHVAIGLALLPPVVLKLGSTTWRFARYYWGDIRYRAAGPPPPALRAMGPLVVVATAAVLVTGIVTWAVGPHQGPWLNLHKVSFIVWFAVMAIHVLAHTPRALRLAAADVGHQKRRVRHRAARIGLVAAAAVAGVALGVASTAITTGWGSTVFHHFH